MHNPHIPAFGKARVLVAGDVMLDRYWHGPTGRISPEAPVPVVRVTELEDRPGGSLSATSDRDDSVIAAAPALRPAPGNGVIGK